MKGDITSDPASIKRIIKDYYEKKCTHKFNNLDEIEQFLKKKKPTKTHVKMKQDNLNNAMTVKEIEFVVLNLLPKIFRATWFHWKIIPNI